MLQQYHTKLKGTLALTDSYLTEKALQREKGLYKFIWVRNGSITVEIDHQEMVLVKDEVISLTHLQHLEFKSIDGEYLTLLFNSNFYCIYGNDHEVSCSGFLFNGSSHLIRFMLNEQERKELDTITEALENEFTVTDSLQEEMLRILLKRFIIQCTRIARNRMNITREKESGFEIVRQYYNLVDEHFRTKKQVQDYADMLHKSPHPVSGPVDTDLAFFHHFKQGSLCLRRSTVDFIYQYDICKNRPLMKVKTIGFHIKHSCTQHITWH